MPDSDNIVITGGYPGSGSSGLSRVVSYNTQGEATLLPRMQQSRYAHGCGYYYNNDQLVSCTLRISIIFVSFTQTYLVTGGYHGGNLASTELLHQDASQWVYAGELPSGRKDLRGATLGDKLIMIGEMMMDDVLISNI